jgi:signal transduction histidine kinase
MLDATHIHENQIKHANGDERSRQFIHHAIELALSLGDFQKEVSGQCSAQMVVEIALERIERLIEFETRALYLVDEDTADLKLAACTPIDTENSIEIELNCLIENGSVAWAIRERRGITLFSNHSNRHLFLHVLSTCSRIRGLFIGVFPEKEGRLPDTSLEMLSIILRNAANSIESLEYSSMLTRQKRELEAMIEEKTQRLVMYEKQILQTQNMEAIAKLAGGIAHQFNNALTSLIGYLDLASMSIDKESKTAGYIERIHPVAERMRYLTNNLLAYAQGGKSMTRIVTLKELLQEAQPAIQRMMKSSVTFSLELADESISVRVDTIQLRMVILAVVENAVEAIAATGIITARGFAIDGSQIDEGARCGSFLCLEIEDNGRGMDKETMRRIFEPFFSTKFEGRGLSMAAVFGIIKNHNGWINVDSKPGNGTRVAIYLPLAAN